VLRRATTIVDEASLSPTTLRGVVAPAPWRARAGEGAGEGEAGGAVVYSWDCNVVVAWWVV
jgi:hypothetical protein